MRCSARYGLLFIVFSGTTLANGPCDMTVQGATPGMSREAFIALMESKGLYNRKVLPAGARTTPPGWDSYEDFATVPANSERGPDDYVIRWNTAGGGTTTISVLYYQTDLGKAAWEERKQSICPGDEEVRTDSLYCSARPKQGIAIRPDKPTEYPQCEYSLSMYRSDVTESIIHRVAATTDDGRGTRTRRGRQ